MRAKKVLNVPSSSADITLGTFQEVMSLGDDKAMEAVALIAGVDVDFLSAMSEADLVKVSELCMKALHDDKTPIKTIWKHEGITYRMHPEFAAMTTGEMTDMETYLNNVDTFHKGIAVAFREQTKASDALGGLYDIVPYTGTSDTAEIFKHIPLSIFYGFKGFFLLIGLELKDNLPHSSIQTGTEQT